MAAGRAALAALEEETERLRREIGSTKSGLEYAQGQANTQTAAAAGLRRQLGEARSELVLRTSELEKARAALEHAVRIGRLQFYDDADRRDNTNTYQSTNKHANARTHQHTNTRAHKHANT